MLFLAVGNLAHSFCQEIYIFTINNIFFYFTPQLQKYHCQLESDLKNNEEH